MTTPPTLTLLTALRLGLYGIIASRKAMMAVLAALSTLGARFGLGFDASEAFMLISPFIAAIGGQAHVDAAEKKAQGVAAAAAAPAAAVEVTQATEQPPTTKTPVMLFLIVAGIVVLIMTLSGCSWFKSQGTTLKQSVVDCTKALAKEEIKQWTPMVKQVIVRATDGEGKIDWPSLDDATQALKAEAFCVVKKTVVDLIAQATQLGAPSSSEVQLNAAEALTGLSELQARRYPDVTFSTE